jgi:putative endonuclease
MKTYWVYILLCSDSSYYTGSTSNLEKRLSEHQNGLIEGYTKNRRPVELVFYEYYQDVNEALVAERQIKGWNRKKKEALINQDFELLKILAKKNF